MHYLEISGTSPTRPWDTAAAQYSFNDVRLACGYTDEYAEAILVVTMVAALLSTLQIALAKVLNRSAKLRGAKSARFEWISVSNLTIRVFYVLFIELAMSMLINVSFADSSSTATRFFSILVLEVSN